jgi:hypothetical protein
LIYVAGFVAMALLFKLRNFWLLLLAALPSSIFFYLPYTESLFYLFSVIMIYGYTRKNFVLVGTGLLFASLTRSAAIVFLPALVLAEFAGENNYRSMSLRIIGLTIISMLAIGIVFYLQFFQTGVLNAYGKTQQYWGLKLGDIHFPFRTWRTEEAGFWVQQLDAVALLTGILAAVFLVRIIFLRIRNQHIFSKELVFSCGYLACVCFSRMVFGQMMSLNRYVFASAFFVVFIHNLPFIQEIITGNKKLPVLRIFIFLLVYWILFIYHGILNTWLNYLPATIIIVVVYYNYFYNHKTQKWAAGLQYGIYLFLVILQALLFCLFLKNLWIG